MTKDMEVKKAKYIAKCNEICQEFFFATAKTKCKLNWIYNMSWYGSALWDLTSEEFLRIESTYNRSIKILFNLPYDTHRYLIETVSNKEHIRTIIFKRYLKFVLNLEKSKKPILKVLYNICKDSTQSVTGRNLRSLKSLTNNFNDIAIDHGDQIEYVQTPEDEEWRTEVLVDLLEEAEVRSLDQDELELLYFVCSS